MIFSQSQKRCAVLDNVSRLMSSIRVYSSPSGTLSELTAAQLKIKRSSTLKPLIPNSKLVFGQNFTDHMLLANWDSSAGWHPPSIAPYGNLSLSPSATVLHYAVECFEGLKAYKDKNGKIRMFRPDMNMNRLHRSCKRLALPTFDREELLALIKEYLKVDERWIPADRGYSLYVRPTVIATQESLGVGPSNKALLFVIASPVGPYYKTGFAPVSLYASKKFVRAWPGGTGEAKIGANYAPGILPQIQAAKDGYQQILWLFGPEDNVTEVGTMNLFVYWKNEHGEKELVTAPLDGTILPGVTRDSILTLSREWNEFKVVEKSLSMNEITKALKEGRVLEMFGSGTAAIVSPINRIHYDGKDLNIPLDVNDTNAKAGPLTRRFADTIMAIQYGEIPHKWSVVVE